MALQLSRSAINDSYVLYPYRTGALESSGYEEISSYYYPRGPIKRVISYFRASGAISMYTGNSEYYDFDHISRDIVNRPSFESGVQNTIFGGGKGPDLPTMMASSLGEIIERALGSLTFYEHDDKLVYGSFNTLAEKGYSCIEPERIQIFADEQLSEPGFMYRRFDRDSFVGWVKGSRLTAENEEIWLPAQIILPFYLAHPQEVLFGYGTSGGLSTHITRELAIYHGISEVLERDAVNVHWNTGHAPKIIDMDCEPDDPRLRRIWEKARTLFDDLTLYLHMTDIEGFYTVTAVGFMSGFNRYKYIAGGGGGLSIESAIMSALGEFSQAESASRIVLSCPEWAYSDRVRELFFVDEDTPVEKFDIFYKVIGHYGFDSHASKLEWYLKGSGKVKLSELRKAETGTGSGKSNYEAILDIAKAHDLDPIFLDFTLPDLKTVRLTKVFCPPLTPPYLHSLPAYGADRYYSLPQKLGWRDRRLAFDDLTEAPQPYP